MKLMVALSVLLGLSAVSAVACPYNSSAQPAADQRQQASAASVLPSAPRN